MRDAAIAAISGVLGGFAGVYLTSLALAAYRWLWPDGFIGDWHKRQR